MSAVQPSVCLRAWPCDTFVATSHVLHNAPSSTNVIVDVDGLLQGKVRQGISVFIETLPVSRTVWDIRLQSTVTLKTGLVVPQSHWKCHHSIQRI